MHSLYRVVYLRVVRPPSTIVTRNLDINRMNDSCSQWCRTRVLLMYASPAGECCPLLLLKFPQSRPHWYPSPRSASPRVKHAHLYRSASRTGQPASLSVSLTSRPRPPLTTERQRTCGLNNSINYYYLLLCVTTMTKSSYWRTRGSLVGDYSDRSRWFTTN